MVFVDENLKIFNFEQIEKNAHFEYIACFDNKQDAKLFVKAKKNEKENK